jgi:hypothetical protein
MQELRVWIEPVEDGHLAVHARELECSVRSVSEQVFEVLTHERRKIAIELQVRLPRSTVIEKRRER